MDATPKDSLVIHELNAVYFKSLKYKEGLETRLSEFTKAVDELRDEESNLKKKIDAETKKQSSAMAFINEAISLSDNRQILSSNRDSSNRRQKDMKVTLDSLKEHVKDEKDRVYSKFHQIDENLRQEFQGIEKYEEHVVKKEIKDLLEEEKNLQERHKGLVREVDFAKRGAEEQKKINEKFLKDKFISITNKNETEKAVMAERIKQKKKEVCKKTTSLKKVWQDEQQSLEGEIVDQEMTNYDLQETLDRLLTAGSSEYSSRTGHKKVKLVPRRVSLGPPDRLANLDSDDELD